MCGDTELNYFAMDDHCGGEDSGSIDKACALTMKCEGNSDCASSICDTALAQPICVGCADISMNDAETDVYCGGRSGRGRPRDRAGPRRRLEGAARRGATELGDETTDGHGGNSPQCGPHFEGTPPVWATRETVSLPNLLYDYNPPGHHVHTEHMVIYSVFRNTWSWTHVGQNTTMFRVSNPQPHLPGTSPSLAGGEQPLTGWGTVPHLPGNSPHSPAGNSPSLAGEQSHLTGEQPLFGCARSKHLLAPTGQQTHSLDDNG